jgi:hypothetical protein
MSHSQHFAQGCNAKLALKSSATLPAEFFLTVSGKDAQRTIGLTPHGADATCLASP